MSNVVEKDKFYNKNSRKFLRLKLNFIFFTLWRTQLKQKCKFSFFIIKKKLNENHLTLRVSKRNVKFFLNRGKKMFRLFARVSHQQLKTQTFKKKSRNRIVSLKCQRQERENQSFVGSFLLCASFQPVFEILKSRDFDLARVLLKSTQPN